MKLGKQPKKVDSRTLKLSNYLESTLLEPPASYGWSKGVMDWQMFDNDTIGDCTIAAIAHQVMAWTFATKNLIVPKTSDVLGVYSAISGYDPTTGLNDNGCAILDVLNYFRQTGLGGHKIAAFAEVDIKNQDQVKNAIYIFGGIDIGVQLPLAVQGADMWVVPKSGDPASNAPGSFGGHCVLVTDYDSKFLRCITWGNELLMTWEFFNTYCDEAYAEISLDFIKNNIAPTGMALANLVEDLKAITT